MTRAIAIEKAYDTFMKRDDWSCETGMENLNVAIDVYEEALWGAEETDPAPEWQVFDVFINEDTPILTAVKQKGEWRSDGNLICIAMWRPRPLPPKTPPTLW